MCAHLLQRWTSVRRTHVRTADTASTSSTDSAATVHQTSPESLVAEVFIITLCLCVCVCLSVCLFCLSVCLSVCVVSQLSQRKCATPLHVIISAKEVTYPSEFVNLLAGLRKKYSTDFHKIRWKVARGPREKTLDFGGNLDHLRLQHTQNYSVQIYC